jgi:hypothetical protein
LGYHGLYILLSKLLAQLDKLLSVILPHLDAVLLLHVDLYGHAVDIETEWKEHLFTLYPVIFSHHVNV